MGRANTPCSSHLGSLAKESETLYSMRIVSRLHEVNGDDDGINLGQRLASSTVAKYRCALVIPCDCAPCCLPFQGFQCCFMWHKLACSVLLVEQGTD